MQLGQFNQVRYKDGTFQLVKQEIPKLEENQVFIKVCYSSVNEYDKVLMDCCCNKKNCAAGAEGSGIIEGVAANVDSKLKGRKVVFCHDGWAQYAVKDQDDLIYLDNSVDLRLAADGIINPMTALSLKKIATDLKADLIVLDGASTSLGRMLIKLFQKDNINIIPFVQDKDSLDRIRGEFGLDRVLDITKGDSLENLQIAAKNCQKALYISMSGGEIPGKILDKLPPKSEMILMSNLQEKDLKLNTSNFLFDSKKIRGFFLDRYLREELDDEIEHKFYHFIADDLKKGGELFGTKVGKEMKLEEFNQAIDQLEGKNFEGKIILQCS